MPTIEQDLQQIRGAVYGREVREAIADGIEKSYDNSAAANAKSDGVNDPLKYGMSIPMGIGTRIDTSGAEVNGPGYAMSSWYPCDLNTKVYMKNIYVGTQTLAYAFYGENRTFISGVGNFTGNVTLDASNIPDTAKYVRFCVYTVNRDPQVFIENRDAIMSKITDIEQVGAGDIPYSSNENYPTATVGWAIRGTAAAVNESKSAITYGGQLLPKTDIVQGTYNYAGDVVSNPNRIRNVGFIPVENGGMVHFEPGANISNIFYGKFASDKSFIGDGAWVAGDISVNWNGYVIVCFKNSTNTAITPSDYDATTVVMTAKEKAKYDKDRVLASLISSENPMNPLFFDLMYFRKGAFNSGTEYMTAFNNPTMVIDDFSSINSATASSTDQAGYMAFRLNDNNQPPVLLSGETCTMFLFVKTNKAVTYTPILSTSTVWGTPHSVAMGDPISLKVGFNCIKIDFAYDHTGTDGWNAYRYFVLSGNTNFSDFDAEISLVRGDNFLGWLKEVVSNNNSEYDTDLLFWGDSLTAGAGGVNTSYPKTCSETLGLSRINAGVGGETANTIAARQGGNNIIIPAGAVNGTYDLNDFDDVFGYHVNPLRQGNGASSGNKIFINGYECTLTITQTSSTSDDATYTISGYTGPALTVPTVAKFAGSEFTGNVVIIWVGANGSNVGGDTSVDARIAIIDSMIKHIGHNRYVVFANWKWEGTETELAADDAAMLKHYGSKLFPVRKLLVNYGLTLMGITPTSQDETDIAAGTIPSSLRSDGVHLNGDGYTAVGKMLADKIRSLGYV